MAKSKPAKTPQSARQIRREQQRQSASIAPVIAPAAASSDLFSPSVLVPLFVAMIVVGCTLFYARGVASPRGNEFSIHQSLFTAVNAATLTGFRQARNPDEYTATGQILTLVLMLGGICFSLICGGAAVLRIARMRFKDSALVIWAIGAIAIAALVGGLALIGQGRTFADDMFQSISAFGNCGLTLGELPAMDSARSTLVLLPLTLLGGLGLPVLMDLVDRLRGGSSLTAHTKTVLLWTAATYFFITAALVALQTSQLHVDADDIRIHLIDASQQAINARSAGFPFEFASRLPQAITFVLVLVMTVGASPGGTAGGIKVTTLAMLSRGTRDALQSKPISRPFAAALLWTGIYLGMLILSTIALLMAVPDIHLDRTLFLSASALGNVGLSYDPVDVSTAGLYVLSATMLLGRVAPMMMLWYLVDTTPECDYRYIVSC